jgi:hypothetical protein
MSATKPKQSLAIDTPNSSFKVADILLGMKDSSHEYEDLNDGQANILETQGSFQSHSSENSEVTQLVYYKIYSYYEIYFKIKLKQLII